MNVTEQGIRFEVGSRPLVFWGDELIPWKHKSLPVRWNIEEPDLLHCLPPGGTPFTMKLRELNSWTATQDELSKTGADRNRWTRSGKAIFDNLPHPLVSQIVRDTEHSAEVHEVGAEIQRQTDEHRGQRAVDEKDRRRLAALAGTLNIPQGIKNPERAIAAEQRRMKRAQEWFQNHDQNKP
ncbi:MAG: hypothetical protein NT154_13530 [Verrucomicrobia bacterium]|nr:hypothetical protein [Verrucomicrobiota bacterium]